MTLKRMHVEVTVPVEIVISAEFMADDPETPMCVQYRFDAEDRNRRQRLQDLPKSIRRLYDEELIAEAKGIIDNLQT